LKTLLLVQRLEDEIGRSKQDQAELEARRDVHRQVLFIMKNVRSMSNNSFQKEMLVKQFSELEHAHTAQQAYVLHLQEALQKASKQKEIIKQQEEILKKLDPILKNNLGSYHPLVSIRN
jgi:hypothetical protein